MHLVNRNPLINLKQFFIYSSWVIRNFDELQKVVGLAAWKLFLFGDESTHPWHQSLYTQIFLLRRHTFSSLDSFSYQKSQSNIIQYTHDSSRCPGQLSCLCSCCQINSFWKWIQFIVEQSKAICWKTQNRWAIFSAQKKQP